MKLEIRPRCNICMEESNNGREYIPDVLKFIDVEMNEDGIYDYECDKGHKTYILIAEELFETLYDLGAMALSDGYTREAVSSFSTSLERYYEFISEVISIHFKLEMKSFQENWKYVAKHSERQFGIFLFYYLLIINKPAPRLHEELRSFRNKVIHEGKIPTMAETYKFGEDVLKLIKETTLLVYEIIGDNEPFIEMQKRKTHRQSSKRKGVISSGKISKPTIIQLRGLGGDWFCQKSLKESIESISKDKRYKYGYRQ